MHVCVYKISANVHARASRCNTTGNAATNNSCVCGAPLLATCRRIRRRRRSRLWHRRCFRNSQRWHPRGVHVRLDCELQRQYCVHIVPLASRAVHTRAAREAACSNAGLAMPHICALACSPRARPHATHAYDHASHYRIYCGPVVDTPHVALWHIETVSVQLPMCGCCCCCWCCCCCCCY